MFLNYQRSSCDLDCHKITLEINDDTAHFVFHNSNSVSHRITVCEPTSISYANNEDKKFAMRWMDGFLENNKTYVIMEVDNDDSNTTKSTKTSKE